MLGGLDPYRLRRAALAAVTVGAFVAGVAASSAVAEGEVDPGVGVDSSATHVEAVVPGGPAWRSGIRAGQTIVVLRPADDPKGGRIETVDDGVTYLFDAASAVAGLKATWPLAGGALVSGGFALLLVRSRRHWALPAALLAYLLASEPLAASGSIALGNLVLAVAAFTPAIWIAWKLPSSRLAKLALACMCSAFLVAWAVARSSGAPTADALEWIRANIATWGALVILVDRLLLERGSGQMLLTRPRPFDVAAIALVASGALALVTLLSLPPLAVAAMATVAVISIPALRRRLRPLENALLADVRAQAAAEASEQERGRLARELHDVPLQELFGVIRRLEVKPGTEAESDDLRALAGHLRNVAIDLRPPVLDDLGLAAALEYLAEGATSPGLPVRAEVSGSTGLAPAQRPPEQVELAFFRIAVEAVANALAHSGASRVQLVARVNPGRVDLLVSDDGSGLDGDRAREAAKAKHMGLISMRRRADAIAADFAIRSTSAGTTIQVVWQA